MFKKTCYTVLVLLSLMCLLCIPVGASLDDDLDRSYYAIGLEYQALHEPTHLEGAISTVYVETSKQGKGGIQQDIQIETSNGPAVVEIVNWYYGADGNRVGVTVYANGEYLFDSKCPAQLGEIYSYEVDIDEGIIQVSIQNSDDKTVFLTNYNCEALNIVSTSSYIEYWRYDEPGSFYYYGCVTVDNTQDFKPHDDEYYKAKGLPFDFYFVHHNWDDRYFDKGEIDDR